MARWTEHGRELSDDLAARWREECLLGEKSLIFGERAVWTKATVADLYERFNVNLIDDRDRPEEERRDFITKFEAQIGDADPEVIILGAECLIVYFLYPSQRTIGHDLRLTWLNQILGWADESLPEGGEIDKAMGFGIGGGGRGYNSNRDAQLRFLIDFSRRFKDESEAKQQELVAEPWTMKAWTDDVEESGREMRHVLLHLLFPDEFERIASGSDKAQIMDAFSGLLADVEDPPADIDQQLHAVRDRLDELGVSSDDEVLDFYRLPLNRVWDSGRHDREEATSDLEALQFKKQVVLYGPPGTSKTFSAKKLAGEIINRQALKRWGPAEYFGNQELVEKLATDQTERLQLHPAYSYEDFIHGLRMGEGGQLEWADGYLMDLAQRIRETDTPEGKEPVPWVLILDEINRVDLSRLLGEAFSLLEDREEPVKLTRGKDSVWFRLPTDLYVIGTMNLIDQSVEQLDFAVRRRFLWVPCEFDGELITEVVAERWSKVVEEGPQWLRRYPWEYLESDVVQLAERAGTLNDEIRQLDLLGKEYELGHTYFFDITEFLRRWPRLQSAGRRPAGYLWDGRGEPQPPLRDLCAYSIEPLLEQYLAGMDDAQSRQQELEQLSNVLFYGQRQRP